MKRLFLLLVACVAMGILFTYMSAPSALAWEGGCEHCDKINGPDESLNHTSTENMTGKGVCAILWKYNGGSNYNVENETCGSEAVLAVTSVPNTITGHGEGEAWFTQFTYTLLLFQWIG